jgi:hypothetical protein
MKCEKCGNIYERICRIDQYKTPCPDCAGEAHRIISASGCFTANEDADWIRSVREVVDKDDDSPATQQFLKEPTRANLRLWMEHTGVRHLEPGEGPTKPPPFDEARHLEKVMEYRRNGSRIEL